jgi:hypothetical protein
MLEGQRGPSIMHLGQFVCKKNVNTGRLTRPLGRRGCLDRFGATQNGAPLICIISRFGCLTQLDRRYIMLSSKAGRATLNTLVTGYENVCENFVLGERKKKRIGAVLALSKS